MGKHEIDRSETKERKRRTNVDRGAKVSLGRRWKSKEAGDGSEGRREYVHRERLLGAS